jgi:hypothetical protein
MGEGTSELPRNGTVPLNYIASPRIREYDFVSNSSTARIKGVQG